MITLLEGTPGSGKSYHAVSEYLLPWLRSGRRMYVYVDGFDVKRLAVFEGRTVESLEKQITTWKDPGQITTLMQQAEPGSVVVIDEAQSIFRSREKQPEEVKRWLETHRHIGIDLLLMAQDYRQMTSGVTRLVEVTVKFRRLDRFGFRRGYQGFVRGNPEETETIRTITGKYSPKIYSYYSSYSVGQKLKEERKQKTILSSPILIAACVAAVAIVVWLMNAKWLSVGPAQAAVPSVEKPAGQKLPPPVNKAQLAGLDMGKPYKGEKVNVLGALTYNGNTYWMKEDGSTRTAAELTAETGAVVLESPGVDGGIPQILSQAVQYPGYQAMPLVEPDWQGMKNLEDKRGKITKVWCVHIDGKLRECGHDGGRY